VAWIASKSSSSSAGWAASQGRTPFGRITEQDRTLVQGLWDQLSPVAEAWRDLGAFPPRVDVPGDATLEDRLLGLAGRDPNTA
jgi:hypothetical protein